MDKQGLQQLPITLETLISSFIRYDTQNDTLMAIKFNSFSRRSKYYSLLHELF